MDLKNTLNLPNPDFTFPMKANLPILEPEMQKKWAELDIYHYIQQVRQGSPTFVLHDGPPYTNGPIHIGTAFNKTLKDIIIKSRSMMGYHCPFTPGYDNHGLPIELTVAADFQKKKIAPDINTLRQACRDHAEKYIEIQTHQFKRLGVFADWEKPYKTMDFKFEAGIVRIFKELVKQGYIYRGLRPVLWSPTAKTALADTEIIYQDHTSHSIYVRFELAQDPNNFFKDFPNVSAIIWTTTPWSLPANVALAFHPDLIYAIIKHQNEHFLVLESVAEKVMGHLRMSEWEQIGKISGNSLEKSTFKHPFILRESLAVTAKYITTEDGTGIVHTAPGHGRDDFYTALRNDLDVLCPVDERGVMTEEAGCFKGLYYTDCSTEVIKKLKESGHLFKHEMIQHSYPYAERDGKPVIFRATEQWFMSIDNNDLRQTMLQQIDQAIEWMPKTGQTRLKAMIANRPDWCVSRQRPWGVGIPILYGKSSGKPAIDSELIEYIAQIIEKEGSDAWYKNETSVFIPPGYKHPETGETEFIKETDVFDVWFDSGCSNLNVLDGNIDQDWSDLWPADLYLEGSDQHRGWFNTSLIIATALKGVAPFKAITTHGFIVDQNGYKMSKRLGNTVDPLKVCEQQGADVLRYWAASVNYEYDAPCYEEILKQCSDGYRRIRNTLRFLLSNLYDYDPETIVPLHELDQWIIEQTDLLVEDCCESYKSYNFSRAISNIHNFCMQEISAFYADSIKDRMYCDGKDWDSRCSAQYASYQVLLKVLKLVAPILVHTAEEVYHYIPNSKKLKSIHAELFDRPTENRLAAIEGNDLETRFAAMLEVRAETFINYEIWKKASGVKDSQDIIVSLTYPENTIDILKSFGEELAIYFKMSEVRLNIGETKIEFLESPYKKCDRSRLRRMDVTEINGMKLTSRDRKVLDSLLQL